MEAREERRHQGRGERAGGFTFVEVITALLVVGIIAALVIPRTAFLASVELQAEARTLASAIRLVYSTAVIERKTYRMVFDLSSQRYWVEEKAGDDFVRSPRELLAERVLPERLYIKRVQILDRSCQEWCQEALYFSPGGYVEEAAIYLSIVEDERTVSIFTRPMTGRTVIIMGDISRSEWEREEGE